MNVATSSEQLVPSRNPPPPTLFHMALHLEFEGVLVSVSIAASKALPTLKLTGNTHSGLLRARTHLHVDMRSVGQEQLLAQRPLAG